MLDSTILQELAERMQRPVDQVSLNRAAQHVMDWLGCAVAGRQGAAGQILRTSGLDEIYVWGGLGNILEMDDVDKRGLLHPGPVIVPAALIAAEQAGASGQDMLSSVVRGYETTIRLGRAVGPGHYALWHNTATCGPIGAAAAAASVFGLSPSQTAQALSLAVSLSAGLWQTRHHADSHGKQLHTAHAARAGLEAARLAGANFRGPLDIIEGNQGFFAAMCPDGASEDVLASYGEDWVIHQVSFKPWPACRHAHAAIDAALEARSQIDIGAPILVSTYSDALTFCDRPEPKTVAEAKFSIQHAVAATVLNGAPRLEDFSEAALSDPGIAAIKALVEVELSSDYEAAYPSRFGARLVCGDICIEIPDALGDPENPIPINWLREKANMLMQSSGVSAGRSKDLISASLALPRATVVGGYVENVRGALT